MTDETQIIVRDGKFSISIGRNASKQDISDMLCGLLDYAHQKDNEDTWRLLYDSVFDENVSTKIFEMCPDFHYPDPDTTYQADVTAFIRGFEDYVREENMKLAEEEETYYVILNMNMNYEICRRCPKSGMFKGTHKECEAYIQGRLDSEYGPLTEEENQEG